MSPPVNLVKTATLQKHERASTNRELDNQGSCHTEQCNTWRGTDVSLLNPQPVYKNGKKQNKKQTKNTDCYAKVYQNYKTILQPLEICPKILSCLQITDVHQRNLV
ncbi:hypothetical protein CRENBAI_004073 [Crenichthys baileyi]|uniref:Uncharacterized protein n=1 Tax=Crenichthys baileyi TaxID=28760 RepID=A0AAV9RNE0_9TELE